MTCLRHKTSTLIITIACLCIFNTSLSAQKQFVPGIVVNNEGDTLDVLIRRDRWKNNPSKIVYKINGNNEVISGELADIKMFQLKGEAKYFRAALKVDRSSDIHVQLTRTTEPIWEDQTAFLKQLAGGDVSLFTYITNKITRFYYQTVESATFEPLIYKKYIFNQRVKHNRGYRKQLQGLFSCGTSFDQLQKIDYTQKDLVKFFEGAGDCSETKLAEIKPKLNPIRTTWRPVIGVNFLSAKMERTVFFGGRVIENYSTESDNFNGLKLGAIGTISLSRKSQKWSATLEGSYENIKFEGTWRNVLHRTLSTDTRGNQTMKIDLHHIVLNLGLKRNFQIRENISLYFSSTWSPGFTFDLSASAEVSTIENIPSTAGAPKIREVGNFSLGFGIEYNAISIELRSNTTRKLLGNSSLFRTSLSAFSILTGFKL